MRHCSEARTKATFDEQQAVMEEMFGQIETLSQIKAQLEEQLAVAQREVGLSATPGSCDWSTPYD